MDKLLSLVTITSSLQLDDLMYTEGKISRQNDPAAATFGRDVKKAYQAHGSRRDLCWCLLMNAELPASSVIGAHLFKWHWHERMHVLGLSDINDMGNGLPLWKPIEWAYDTSRLCFVYDKSRDELVAHVLDNSILGIQLVQKGRELMGPAWRAPGPYRLRALTYQDVHMHPLVFAPGSLQRPIKRILNFHARQARKYAILHGWNLHWPDPLWNFEDFLTEGLEVSEKLRHWYSTMVA